MLLHTGPRRTVKSAVLDPPAGMGKRPNDDLIRFEEMHESVRRTLEANARAGSAGGSLVATSTSGEAMPKPSRFVTFIADAGLREQLLVGYSDGSAFVMKIIGGEASIAPLSVRLDGCTRLFRKHSCKPA